MAPSFALRSIAEATAFPTAGRAPSSAPAPLGPPLGWPLLQAALPDGGFPPGVVELRAPLALGGATTLALAAVRAAQRHEAAAWCAWLDPDCTLYAPGLVLADVELSRLLVVHPPRASLLRTAVKVARAAAFAVIVIDLDAGFLQPAAAPLPVLGGLEIGVRKLALVAREVGCTVLLVTDARRRQPAPLPVALRLELTQTPTTLHVHVGKDRWGRQPPAQTIPFATQPRCSFDR